jgi:hypothetical protein
MESDKHVGKVYVVICNTTLKMYYGATFKDVLKHVRKNRKQLGLAQILKADNYQIDTVERSLLARHELKTRLDYWIKNNECVNSQNYLAEANKAFDLWMCEKK